MDQEHTSAPPPAEPAQPWPAYSPPSNGRRNPARLVIASAAAALIVGGVIGYFLPHSDADKPKPAGSTKPGTVSLVGTLTVVGHGNGELDRLGDGSCMGSGGYSDIAAGTQVVITDDSGKTLTITHLEPGSGDQFSCEFQFRADVPSGRGYYGVEVSHRGVVKQREVDLGGIAISLGN